MRLSLQHIRATKVCAKPGCKSKLVYRHHKGGERTFVRHLGHLLFSPKHREACVAFRRRYYAFLDTDVVEICGDHHEEVHDLMEAFDLDWMVENDCIHRYSLFTWEEAMKLVEARRAFTDQWLLTETPGLTTRKFTGRP